jgi:hypothetical protein
LIAWGLATVVEDVLRQAGVREHGDTLVEDGETQYVVRLPQPIQKAWLEHLRPRRFTYYLAKDHSSFTGSESSGVVFLNEEYEKARQYRAMPDDTPENREARASRSPHRFLSHFSTMSDLQADEVVNKIFLLVPENVDSYRLLIETVLSCFSGVEAEEIEWLKLLKKAKLPADKVTASSLLNPTQGKGDNSPKPKGTSPNNIKVVWVCEWLKIIGFHEAGAAAGFKNTQNKIKDYRVAVIVPRRIRLRHHRDIFRRFLPTYFGSSAVKLDCLSALQYAWEFLAYSKEEPEERTAMLGLSGRYLSDMIRGVLCAGFLKTSQFAFSISRVTGYDLPAWVYLKDDIAVINRYQDAISEHRRCVGKLNDKRGEQVTMLEDYRDWLSTGKYHSLFAFFAGYASHRIRCAVEGERCPAFTTSNLEVIFMNYPRIEKPLSPILQSQGFRNVATAIRKGTINAQYQRKQNKLPSGFEVHFGLSHELRRNATYRDRFISTLCNYLNTYNLENLRVSSRSAENSQQKYLRKNVETSDIEEIVRLTDEYGSELICGLLLAYGYAKDAHDTDVDDEEQNDDEGETSNG